MTVLARHTHETMLTASVLLDALTVMAVMDSAMVEQASLSVCHEFDILTAALDTDNDAVRAACRRAMEEMQFQDRHTQTMQDMGVLLQALRSGGTTATLETICSRVQLRETRDLLRRLMTGEDPVHVETGTVELF